LWGALQFLVFVLFVGLIYKNERDLIAHIQFLANRSWASSIYDFLLRQQWGVFGSSKSWLLGIPLMAGGIGFILFKRWRWFYFALLGIVISLFIIADRVYFDCFHTLIPAARISATTTLWDVRASIFHLLRPSDLAAILPFFLFGIFGIIVNRNVNFQFQRNKTGFWADKAIGVLLFVISLHCFDLAYYFEKNPIKIKLSEGQYIAQFVADQSSAKKSTSKSIFNFAVPHKNSSINYAVCFGALNFHARDFASFLLAKFQSRSLETGTIAGLESWLEKKHQLNARKSPWKGIAQGRNVFLIALESMHPVCLDLKIDDVEITPHLSRLKRDGIYWPSILDLVKTGGSSDAEFAIFTGLIPDDRAVSSFGIPTTVQLLAFPDLLKKYGYSTYSFHGHKATFWNRNLNHPRYGIDRLCFKTCFDSDEKLGMGVPDHLFFPQVLKKLKTAREPFFAYLITLSTHHPYRDVPEGYRELFKESLEPGSEAAGYFQLIRYLDDAVGAFIEATKKAGIYDNSIFIFAGDHHPPMSEATRDIIRKLTGQNVWAPRQRTIPLIIHVPGEEIRTQRTQGGSSAVVGDLHDLFPTLFHLLGIDIPYGISGVNLFVPNSDRGTLPARAFNPRYFLHNGVLYDGGRLMPYKDEQGLIFTNGESQTLSGEECKTQFEESVREKMFHEIIFDFNAQKIAIENRGLGKAFYSTEN
jgi:phosphoglycerol transferase MdoB-like AlkP superfamily enzyme